MKLLKLREKLSPTQSLVLGVIGLLILLAVWWAAAEAKSETSAKIDDFQTEMPNMDDWTEQRIQTFTDSLAMADSIAIANATEFEKVYPLIPPPSHVVQAFNKMHQKDNIIKNTWISILRNIKGYFWAVFFSLIVGFAIGLYPLFYGLFSRQLNALRYLPLTAMVGLFIIWFGIGDRMKVAFLAFGIIVYLLPVVIQRIKEVEDVYLKTVFTLGATDWQTIKTVYFPSVMSKLIDDIRVLTAISWTYIIIIEYINREGGLGSLVYVYKRNGNIAEQFAVLLIIILVGFLQDRLFQYLDKRLFPHKYYKQISAGFKEVQFGIYIILGMTMLTLILTALFPALANLSSMILPIVLVSALLLSLFGEFNIFKSQRKHA